MPHQEKQAAEASQRQRAKGRDVRAKSYVGTQPSSSAARAAGGGSDGAFFALDGKCMEVAPPGEFKYSLCFYGKVSQIKKNSPRDQEHIGSSWSWLGGMEDRVMHVSGGDGTSCPGRMQRQAEVHFTCGVADALTGVSEKEPCVYDFEMTTPAACR